MLNVIEVSSPDGRPARGGPACTHGSVTEPVRRHNDGCATPGAFAASVPGVPSGVIRPRYRDHVQPASLAWDDAMRIRFQHAAQDAKAEDLRRIALDLLAVAEELKAHPESRLARLLVRHHIEELAVEMEDVAQRPDV